MFCRQYRRDGLVLVLRFPIFLPDAERPFKQPCFPAAGRFSFLYDLVIDLLEKPRHGRHYRRLDLLQMRRELVERGAVMYRDAVRAKHVKNGPLKNMRQRQNGERSVGVRIGRPFEMAMTFETKFSCVSITPFGSPVVPDV